MRIAERASSQQHALRRLRPTLDHLYATGNRLGHEADPVEIVRRYEALADREVVAFLAAGLAFGRVRSILTSVERLVGAMGSSPAAFVASFSEARDAGRLRGIRHRWIDGRALLDVLLVLRRMLEEHGSIEAAFLHRWDRGAPDVGAGLEAFSARALAWLPARAARAGSRGATYFFPRPSSGSACKRLNLFLRWMVRQDAVDPGGWRGIGPAQLIVPLDTHVVRVGQCLRLTSRQTPGWRMAVEITAALRALDPDDPVKYDFALCHLGMSNRCGFTRAQGDRDCPLRGVCRPAAGRRRASHAPSARR